MKNLSEFQKVGLYMLVWIMLLLVFRIAEHLLDPRVLGINVAGGAILGLLIYLINRYVNKG